MFSFKVEENKQRICPFQRKKTIKNNILFHSWGVISHTYVKYLVRHEQNNRLKGLVDQFRHGEHNICWYMYAHMCILSLNPVKSQESWMPTGSLEDWYNKKTFYSYFLYYSKMCLVYIYIYIYIYIYTQMYRMFEMSLHDLELSEYFCYLFIIIFYTTTKKVKINLLY